MKQPYIASVEDVDEEQPENNQFPYNSDSKSVSFEEQPEPLKNEEESKL